MDLTLTTADGTRLAATLLGADERAPSHAVVLNSATAVKRGYYATFARHLAAKGIPLLTYDYRGIGGSRPKRLQGYRAKMRDWAEQDMVAAVATMRERFPDAKLVGLGHSAGGWLVPLSPAAPHFDRLVFVGAQAGWWGHWPRPARYKMWSLWHVTIPGVSRVVGYLPGRLGIGEDLPGGIAREWAHWGRHRAFVARDPGVRRLYANVTCPLIAYSFADDPYAPSAAVDALLTLFANAPTEHRSRPGPMGHFGLFRERQGRALWDEIVDAIASEVTPSARTSRSPP